MSKMKKELCRYAVRDIKTGTFLVCGVKYKEKNSLHYVESFRSLCTFFKKVDAYERFICIKGRCVQVVYWFNVPKDIPCRSVTDAGLILGLQ